jgi:uncharacterized membrane protein YheB (UPF0754 family)
MQDFISKYLERHYRLNDIFAIGNKPILKKPAPIQISRVQSVLLLFFQLGPWLCGLGLLFSFYWDFGLQDNFQVGSLNIHMDSLIRMVSVSGLIGFGTNWVVIKMLFFPKKPRPIFGQGILPANKDRILYDLVVSIVDGVLNEKHLKKHLHKLDVVSQLNRTIIDGTNATLADPEFKEDLRKILVGWADNFRKDEVAVRKVLETVDRRLDDAIPQGLSGAALRAFVSMNRTRLHNLVRVTLHKLPKTIDKELDANYDLTLNLQTSLIQNSDKTEALIAHTIHDLIERLDFYTILKANLGQLSEEPLEDMIWVAVKDKLLYIQYLGCLLGMLGGLLLWQPVLIATLYVVIGGGLWLLDNLLLMVAQDQKQATKAS